MEEKIGNELSKNSIVDIVTQKLKENILSGILCPGQRLKELDLSEKMGVSRTPIRKALDILCQEGYLKRTPNRGITVEEIEIITIS